MGNHKIENHNICGVSKTVKIIGSKWTMHILHHLMEGKKRFGQLQRELHPISPKTLSLRLHELEKEGIVRKKVFAEVPIRVEYTLTHKGSSLSDVFAKMAEWGDKR